MKWVAWRQYRLELIICLVVLVVLAAFLIPERLQRHALYPTVVTLIGFVPLIIGALLASPVILDFEQRTYRLAWTQSITRRRWLVTKLGFALIVAIIFSTFLSVLTGWYLAPQERLGSPFNYFAQHGIMPVVYAVFAFALALVLGAWSKRTALAVIVALVVCFAAVTAVGSGLRPHYMTPVEQVNTITSPPTMNGTPHEQIPIGAWIVDSYYIDASGKRLSHLPWSNSIIESPDVSGNGTSHLPTSNESIEYPVREVVEYQPAGRFWPFQGIESSIFLGISVMLLGTTIWVVTRRMR